MLAYSDAGNGAYLTISALMWVVAKTNGENTRLSCDIEVSRTVSYYNIR